MLTLRPWGLYMYQLTLDSSDLVNVWVRENMYGPRQTNLILSWPLTTEHKQTVSTHSYNLNPLPRIIWRGTLLEVGALSAANRPNWVGLRLVGARTRWSLFDTIGLRSLTMIFWDGTINKEPSGWPSLPTCSLISAQPLSCRWEFPFVLT